MGSILKKSEAESIARNIMAILSRTGNEWRTLSWEEYVDERKKDHATDKGGGFRDYLEKPYFEQVAGFCSSPSSAEQFCKGWGK